MTTAHLDSFQLIVGLYLIYIAIKGSGQMYRFFDLSDHDQQRVKKPLRIIYCVCGLLALMDSGLCMLQNSMFTQTVTETTTVITQNYSIDSLPFLSFDFLNIVTSVLTILVICGLLAAFIWLRILSSRK